MTSSAVRLLTLITLLQRRPNQKAAELAQALGISVRSLHRYMEKLDEIGLPIYTERGPLGGFSLVRGYRMPPLIFTPDEAVVLSLGAGLVEDLLGTLYRPAARSALAKLDSVMPDDQRNEAAWAQRALIASGMPRADLEALAGRLEILRDSLRDLRRVRLVYQGGGGRSERDLDPYALAFRQGWWYVVGYCHLRLETRLFRVDRIVEITLLKDGYQIPAGFDAKQYLRSAFQPAEPLQVTMRFSAPFAHLAHEGHAAWESMQDEADGCVLVTLKAPDVNWAASTALAYGPAVAVVAPPEVMHRLREWALAVAQQY